jgi:proteasome accessory factor A
MALDDRLDWVAKRKLLAGFMEAEGAGWHDDVMQSLDLEYHNVNPESGLYYGLLQAGMVHRVTSDEAIEEAICEAPHNTRAAGRSEVVRKLIERRNRRYVIDWDCVFVDRERVLELKNPFSPYRKEAANFIRKL